MSKKKTADAPAANATNETPAPSVQIASVEFTGGRKSDYARSLITANLQNLKGEQADAFRGAVVTALCSATGMARALARVYIKENIGRVERRQAAAATQAVETPTS